MGESFAKREKTKQKVRDKKDKADKMLARKFDNNKGKKLEDMMVYLDENGNMTSKPPDGRIRREINLDDIQLGAAPVQPEEVTKFGMVSFFNDAKGYGFIIEEKTQENIFVHMNQLLQPVKERDKVTFEKERSPRGYNAIKVKKLN